MPAQPRPRALLIAFGTRGDVMPTLAVARSLSRLGTGVRVAAPSDFVATVEASGLEPVDLGVGATEMLSGDLGRRWVSDSDAGSRRALSLLRDMFATHGPVVADTLRREHRPEEALASNLFTFGPARALAEDRRVPHAQLLLAPSTPSREPECTIQPLVRRTSRLNALGGHIGLRAVHWASRQVTNATRTSLGLDPWTGSDFVAAFAQTPTIYGISPVMMPPDRGWTERVHVTGFWFPPDATPGPAGDVQKAVAEAERPVYIGLGSMLDGVDRSAFEQMAVAAASSAGAAPILGMAPRADGDAPSGVCYAPDVDHAWLFPRLRAVVHHGGAGTTAQALRAGVPSLAVPSLGDQHYWGRRLHELGVGPAPLRRKELTVEALSSAIRAMLDEPSYATSARAAAGRLRAGPGADEAAAHLRRVLDHRHRP